MAVFDLFSKRRMRLTKPQSDILEYDDFPQTLRTQIVHIWREALGRPSYDWAFTVEIQRLMVDILRKERGVFNLIDRDEEPWNELTYYFMGEKTVDYVLDVVEVVFRSIDKFTRQYQYMGRQNFDAIADGAIEELNERFKEHSVGYYFADGQIVRMDTAYAHEELTKPALAILRRKGFSNAQAEFLSAHEHFRFGKNSEVLIDCYKAFESTMKIIIHGRGWKFDPNDSAATLVRICFEQKLIPDYFQSHFSGLRSILESAIPTPRNKQAGHGAGAGPARVVPNELASYVLNLTAATILFLTEADAKFR